MGVERVSGKVDVGDSQVLKCDWDPTVLPLNREGLVLEERQINEELIRRYDGCEHQNSEFRRLLLEQVGMEDYGATVGNGQALVLANLGETVSIEDHVGRIVDHGSEQGVEFDPGVVARVLAPTGAEIVSWVRGDLPQDYFVGLETAVAEKLGKLVLEKSGILAEEIGFVGFASSAPASLLSAEYVSEVLGCENADNYLASTACSSSRRLKTQMLEDYWEQPDENRKWGLIVGAEYMMTLRKRRDEFLTGSRDLGGLSFFSDRAFAYLVDRSKWRNLVLVDGQVPDVGAALPGINTVPLVAGEESDGIMFRSKYGVVTRLPQTRDEGNILELHPMETSRLFMDVTRRASEELMDKLSELGLADLDWVDVFSGHRANRVIYEKKFVDSRRGLTARGLREGLANWEIPGMPSFGNAPVVTMADEMWRNWGRYRPGVAELFAFFAAGANYQFGVDVMLEPGDEELSREELVGKLKKSCDL